MTTIRARLAQGRSASADDFADITDADVSSVGWGSAGEIEVTFDGDLTAEQRQRVTIRLISDSDADEAMLLQARTAHEANVVYLDKPGHTTAEALAQVDALTRHVNHLIRYIARL